MPRKKKKRKQKQNAGDDSDFTDTDSSGAAAAAAPAADAVQPEPSIEAATPVTGATPAAVPAAAADPSGDSGAGVGAPPSVAVASSPPAAAAPVVGAPIATEPKSPEAGASSARRGVCHDYTKSKCTRGDKCKFEHVDCKSFLRGSCKYGEKCSFRHAPASPDKADAPVPPKEGAAAQDSTSSAGDSTATKDGSAMNVPTRLSEAVDGVRKRGAGAAANVWHTRYALNHRQKEHFQAQTGWEVGEHRPNGPAVGRHSHPLAHEFTRHFRFIMQRLARARAEEAKVSYKLLAIGGNRNVLGSDPAIHCMSPVLSTRDLYRSTGKHVSADRTCGHAATAPWASPGCGCDGDAFAVASFVHVYDLGLDVIAAAVNASTAKVAFGVFHMHEAWSATIGDPDDPEMRYTSKLNHDGTRIVSQQNINNPLEGVYVGTSYYDVLRAGGSAYHGIAWFCRASTTNGALYEFRLTPNGLFNDLALSGTDEWDGQEDVVRVAIVSVMGPTVRTFHCKGVIAVVMPDEETLIVDAEVIGEVAIKATLMIRDERTSAALIRKLTSWTLAALRHRRDDVASQVAVARTASLVVAVSAVICLGNEITAMDWLAIRQPLVEAHADRVANIFAPTPWWQTYAPHALATAASAGSAALLYRRFGTNGTLVVSGAIAAATLWWNKDEPSSPDLPPVAATWYKKMYTQPRMKTALHYALGSLAVAAALSMPILRDHVPEVPVLEILPDNALASIGCGPPYYLAGGAASVATSLIAMGDASPTAVYVTAAVVGLAAAATCFSVYRDPLRSFWRFWSPTPVMAVASHVHPSGHYQVLDQGVPLYETSDESTLPLYADDGVYPVGRMSFTDVCFGMPEEVSLAAGATVKVTAESGCRRKPSTHLFGMAFGPPPIVPSACAHNLVRAIATRQLVKQGVPADGAWAEVFERTKDTVLDIHNVTEMEEEVWLKRYPLHRHPDLRAGREQFEQGDFGRFELRYDTFVKGERAHLRVEMAGEDGADAFVCTDPRLICACSNAVKAGLGPFFVPWARAMEKHLKDYADGSFRYSCTTSSIELGMWYSLAYAIGLEPICCDFSRLDSSIHTKAWLEFLFPLYKQGGIPAQGLRWMRMMCKKFRGIAKYTDVGGDHVAVTAEGHGTMGSGRDDTSGGDTAIVVGVIYDTFVREFGRLPSADEIRVIIKGDDTLIMVMRGLRVRLLRALRANALRLGLKAKAFAPAVAGDVEFCSGLFLPYGIDESGDLIFAFSPRIGRAMYKMGWATRRQKVRNLADYAYSVGTSIKPFVNHVPVLRVLAARYIELGTELAASDGRAVKFVANEFDWVRKRPNSIELPYNDGMLVDAVCEVYDISRAEIAALEDTIRSAPLTCLIKSYVADTIISRDVGMGGWAVDPTGSHTGVTTPTYPHPQAHLTDIEDISGVATSRDRLHSRPKRVFRGPPLVLGSDVGAGSVLSALMMGAEAGLARFGWDQVCAGLPFAIGPMAATSCGAALAAWQLNAAEFLPIIFVAPILEEGLRSVAPLTVTSGIIVIEFTAIVSRLIATGIPIEAVASAVAYDRVPSIAMHAACCGIAVLVSEFVREPGKPKGIPGLRSFWPRVLIHAAFNAACVATSVGVAIALQPELTIFDGLMGRAAAAARQFWPAIKLPS